MYLLIRLSVKGAGAPVRRSKRAPAFPPPVEGCAALLRSEFFALRPKKRRPLSEYLFLLYGQPCRIARRKSSRYSQFVCGEIAFSVRLFCAAGGHALPASRMRRRQRCRAICLNAVWRGGRPAALKRLGGGYHCGARIGAARQNTFAPGVVGILHPLQFIDPVSYTHLTLPTT